MLKGAQLVFGDSVLDCVVSELSRTGARVRLRMPFGVPEQVTLRFLLGSAYPARRRWANGAELGLEFLGEGLAADDERQRLARRVEHAIRAANPATAVRLLRAAWYLGDEELRRAAEAAELAYERLLAALAPHARTGATGALDAPD